MLSATAYTSQVILQIKFKILFDAFNDTINTEYSIGNLWIIRHLSTSSKNIVR